jgi:hypothetical protein
LAAVGVGIALLRGMKVKFQRTMCCRSRAIWATQPPAIACRRTGHGMPYGLPFPAGPRLGSRTKPMFPTQKAPRDLRAGSSLFDLYASATISPLSMAGWSMMPRHRSGSSATPTNAYREWRNVFSNPSERRSGHSLRRASLSRRQPLGITARTAKKHETRRS